MAIQIENKALKDYGFTQINSREIIEDGLGYDWFELRKNESKLDFVKEFTASGKFIKQYVMFNDKKLYGFTYSVDLELLINLM